MAPGRLLLVPHHRARGLAVWAVFCSFPYSAGFPSDFMRKAQKAKQVF